MFIWRHVTELKWAERERIAQNFVLYFSSRNNVLHIQHNIHPDKIYFKHLMWETILPNVFSYSVFQSYLSFDERSERNVRNYSIS